VTIGVHPIVLVQNMEVVMAYITHVITGVNLASTTEIIHLVETMVASEIQASVAGDN